MKGLRYKVGIRFVATRTLRTWRIEITDDVVERKAVLVVRGVRVVLPPDAHRFRRIVACASCERETVGGAIAGPADLRRRPARWLCPRCSALG